MKIFLVLWSQTGDLIDAEPFLNVWEANIFKENRIACGDRAVSITTVEIKSEIIVSTKRGDDRVTCQTWGS